MKVRKRKIAVAILLCLLLVAISGCQKTSYKDYKGEFSDLYTVAVNSLVGARGYSRSSSEPSYYDPEIVLIEEDTYGRKLFQYYEEMTTYDGFNSFLGLLILQKADTEFVYYYSEDCFILQKPEVDTENTTNYPDYTFKPFPSGKIEELKSKNDWDNEINIDKCIKAAIIQKKQAPNVKINDSTFESIFAKVAADTGYKGDDTLFRWSVYLNSDQDGKILYYAYGVGCDLNGQGVSTTSERRAFYLMIIFNSDGSYDLNKCVYEMSDLYSYQEDLKALKGLNNWNQSM